MVKLQSTDLLMFLQQLRVLLAAGNPISRALELIHGHTGDLKLRKHLDSTLRKLKTGGSLSDALFGKEHPFPDSMAHRLATLPTQKRELEDILKNLEDNTRLGSRFRLAAPGWLTEDRFLLIFFSLFAFLMVYGIPRLFLGWGPLSDSFGGSLPGPTAITLAVSLFLKDWWPVAWLVLTVLIYYLVFWGNRLRSQSADLVYLFSLLQGQIKNGADLKQALDRTEQSLDSAALKKIIVAVRRQVENGQSLSEALRATKYFPPMVADMIAFGEKNGDLISPVQEIISYYAVFVGRGIQINRKGVLLLILFFGFVIVWVALSMYLSIFKMGATI